VLNKKVEVKERSDNKIRARGHAKKTPGFYLNSPGKKV
jgi:hypothetical protein